MTPISRRDWWLGVAIVLAALLLRTALPRYEWRDARITGALIRVDRWTGRATLGRFITGTWQPITPPATRTGRYSLDDIQP